MTMHVLRFKDFGANIEVDELNTQKRFVSQSAAIHLRAEIKLDNSQHFFKSHPFVDELFNGLKFFSASLPNKPKNKEKKRFSWDGVSDDNLLQEHFHRRPFFHFSYHDLGPFGHGQLMVQEYFLKKNFFPYGAKFPRFGKVELFFVKTYQENTESVT